MHWNAAPASAGLSRTRSTSRPSNRVGTDEGLTFGGSSRLIDPFGTLLASASETDETLLVEEATRERLTEVRSGLKVFADRRPELY